MSPSNIRCNPKWTDAHKRKYTYIAYTTCDIYKCKSEIWTSKRYVTISTYKYRPLQSFVRIVCVCRIERDTKKKEERNI